VTDGFTDPVSQPISVINVPAQAEVSTFFTDEDFSSSDFCSNSSVLVTANDIVRKLILSRAGTLTDTGEALSVTEPWNVYCAPGGQSGVVIHRSSSSGWEVTSFTIPGLSAVNTRPLSGLTSGLSGAISPSGNRVFVRSNGPGSVDVFDFNSATGALGADPLLTISIADAPVFFIGMEQLALHPNGEVVFVPEPGKVNVYNTSTGALITSITDPAIEQPSGITVARKRK
jgi:hypothetical protein